MLSCIKCQRLAFAYSLRIIARHFSLLYPQRLYIIGLQKKNNNNNDRRKWNRVMRVICDSINPQAI